MMYVMSYSFLSGGQTIRMLWWSNSVSPENILRLMKRSKFEWGTVDAFRLLVERKRD